MGNNKETRARRNEWERTFPRLFACFRACVECMRSHGGNFSFLEGVFFLIYDIVSRASTVDEGGADQTRFLDRIPAWTSIDVAASRDNFGQSPVPLVIFLAREKGVKCLSSISNRKFRDQIHPRFEARYYFSVYEWRTMKLEEGNRLLLHHFWRCARENILIVDRNFNIVKEDLFLYP